MERIDKEFELEGLKDWIAENIQRNGIARVSQRILRIYLRDPIEESISVRSDVTWQDLSLLTGKLAKTKTDLFEEWLKEEDYEYYDSPEEPDQIRIFQRKSDKTGS